MGHISFAKLKPQGGEGHAVLNCIPLGQTMSEAVLIRRHSLSQELFTLRLQYICDHEYASAS
jgi:hypothetical protein